MCERGDLLVSESSDSQSQLLEVGAKIGDAGEVNLGELIQRQFGEKFHLYGVFVGWLFYDDDY